ncbi:MAG: hypothetical protein MJ001_08855 [Paludibacteraceae bacterium]|nr:hypothetical protein [Paludibacteraceae bacterium]
MLQSISYILNALLGSGLFVTLLTIKSTKAKANANAKAVEIDNNRKLLDNFDSFIVQPLKTEVYELRQTIQNLQLAIKQIPSCPHADTCPVTDKLNQLHNPSPKPNQYPDPNHSPKP